MTPWDKIPDKDKTNLIAAYYFSVNRIAVGSAMYNKIKTSIEKYPEWHDEEAIKSEQERIEETNRLRQIETDRVWNKMTDFFNNKNEND